jgi:HEPN domain-containing protein
MQSVELLVKNLLFNTKSKNEQISQHSISLLKQMNQNHSDVIIDFFEKLDLDLETSKIFCSLIPTFFNEKTQARLMELIEKMQLFLQKN